ncbi:hypothetical protein AB0300_16580 [Microbacterium sp. NPDC078814]|uniref:hypothetical protein n=1 Tax=Microbacterium sp. NPDC078814 TaxID=3154767 RepID=UPI00344D8A51
MSITDRALLPVARTLTPGTGAQQLAAWREFNDDYLLDVDRRPGEMTNHHARVEDAFAWLTELVRTEQSCCAFVAWSIDTTHADLRLTVVGSDDALDVLSFLEHTPTTAREEAR